MKCPNCQQENKDSAINCKKCDRDLTMPPAWFPDWRWHARTLGVIYSIVVVAYLGVTFALKQLPEPYNVRKIPPKLTPWLNH
jgi:hypothetical protein